jgi:hypothetical protein
MESTWVFTYWEAGDKVALASSTPTKKFSGVWENYKLGEWLRTKPMN